MTFRTVLLATGLSAILGGCGFVHDEQLVGPYRLIAVDTEDDLDLSYRLPGGDAIGRVPATVFAVGWNDRYLVAKQHPSNNRSITNYYVVDQSKDGPLIDPSKTVAGPMSAAEYERASRELGLPGFSLTVASLE